MSTKPVRASGHSDMQSSLKFLGYGLPGRVMGAAEESYDLGRVQLCDAPLRNSVSFLSFDGVVLFAGTYESGNGGAVEPTILADLHQRERQLYTMFAKGSTVIFLIPYLVDVMDDYELKRGWGLFRSTMCRLGIKWQSTRRPSIAVESLVPEFADYTNHYGTGYVALNYKKEADGWIRPLFHTGQTLYGLVVEGHLFLLPCAIPDNHEQAIEMCKAAIAGTAAYRARMSGALPEWVEEFSFTEEAAIKAEANTVQQKLSDIEAEIGWFRAHKGVLAHRSERLVEEVCNLVEAFFGVELSMEEECIQDATLRDTDGNVLGVFEIKGVNGNFKRENINQLDSHRERLELEQSTPGILIMNTMMGAHSLDEKDVAPHPETIKKAVESNVLMVRTLDLLQLADAVQRGALRRDEFREAVLSQAGWLHLAGGQVQVTRE